MLFKLCNNHLTPAPQVLEYKGKALFNATLEQYNECGYFEVKWTNKPFEGYENKINYSIRGNLIYATYEKTKKLLEAVSEC